MANPLNVPGYHLPRTYNEGHPSVGQQIIDFHFQRAALIDLAKEQYFGQLANTKNMPKCWAA